MTPIAIVTCAAVLWSCAVAASSAAGVATTPGVQVSDASSSEGPSLSEITRVIETHGFQTSGTLFEMLGSWMIDNSVEGRGKKAKPMKMAMAMAGAAAGGMMMMKAMGAIKLFIIHAFLATKLGLIIGLYLLLCKMMEMKQTPPKKVVKWVSPPSHYEEHPAPISMMGGGGPYPESQSSYMEPQQQQQQQQQHPADQYGPPPQQQYMPSGDFGGGNDGGGDMQAHYSHVSPVTYRPVINRGQSDGKSGAAGRI